MASSRPAESWLEASETARPPLTPQHQITPEQSKQSTTHRVSLPIRHAATNHRIKHVLSADGRTTLYTFQQNRTYGVNYNTKPHIVIYVPNRGIPPPSTSKPSAASPPGTTMNQFGTIDLDTLVITLQNMLPIRLKPNLNKAYSFDSAALPGRMLTWEDALFGNLLCHDQDGTRVAKFRKHGILSPLKTGTFVLEPLPIGQSRDAIDEIVMTGMTIIERKFKRIMDDNRRSDVVGGSGY
ncbi:MAG: hypothetical protein Q9218_007428 [Villophora microphyllina]